MSANFDILIVGGGPAGISAALTAVNRRCYRKPTGDE